MSIKIFFKKHSKKIGFLLAGFLLYISFKDTNFKLVWDKFKSMKLIYMVLAIVSMFLAYITKVFRWKEILKPINNCKFKNIFHTEQ